MRPPIIVDEHGDVQVFESSAHAEIALEAVDVRNDEYTVYDSRGRLLTISAIDKGDTVRITSGNQSLCHRGELKKVLSSFLKRTGDSHEVESMTLKQLIDRCLAKHGFAR